MTDNSLTPPGWYPHPEYPERNRYWDGLVWSDQAPDVAEDSEEPSSAAGVPPETKGGLGCFGMGCLVTVGLILLIGISTAVIGATKSDTDSHDDAAYASVLCQGEVSDSLKSPSTAAFSNVAATRTADLMWSVSGTVDAQNAFGAEIRNYFECTMEVRESDGFTRTTLISLG